MNLFIIVACLFKLLCSENNVCKQTIHDILDPFTGKWQGTFKVYSYDGRLIDQLEVEQRYWWEGDEQHAVFIERYRNGKVVHARARNYEKDGQLLCEVEKDTGEHTAHLGRFEDGVLFWYRQTQDGNVTESFKERVAKTAVGREYQIDGLGVYKSDGSTSVLLFEGRYREVK